MWVLLVLPRFGEANHASGHNYRSRYRKVGVSGPWRRCGRGNVLIRRQLKRRYVLAFFENKAVAAVGWRGQARHNCGAQYKGSDDACNGGPAIAT